MSAKRSLHDGITNSEEVPGAKAKNANGKIDLDDFITELKQRNEDMSSDVLKQNVELSHKSDENGLALSSPNQTYTLDLDVLYAQLAQKDKDLILAAELGKALLDRNEELSRTNEQISEEYTRQLELLEQEKYALRKKLNSVEIEYENKIHELQTDLYGMREKLNVHFEISKQNESENSRIIEELTEQNQRLTNELKKSSKRESTLEKEIQSLKEQFNARRTNFTDHIDQLEGLRDEINLLSKRKFELESKISSLNEEKESISISLDESQYKILTLEKQLYEKELSLQSQQKDLDELRRMSIQYQNKLDTLNKMRSFESYKLQGASLYNEIEMSSHSSDENNLHASPNYYSEEDIELSTPDNLCIQCAKNKRAMLDVYGQLKSLYDEIFKRRMNDSTCGQGNALSNSNHDSGIQANLSCNDEINFIICDIRELVRNVEFMQCITCHEFSNERSELDRVRKENNLNKDEVHKLNNEIMRLTSSVTIQGTELDTLREENQILKDDLEGMTTLSKDEIVQRALKMRDDTISRKNTVEIELAKMRIELMHVNSQLLETIQQKVELSQQLEQWQVDMEILIEEQLRNKLSLHEQTRAKAVTENTNKKENIFDRIRLSKFLNYQS